MGPSEQGDFEGLAEAIQRAYWTLPRHPNAWLIPAGGVGVLALLVFNVLGWVRWEWVASAAAVAGLFAASFYVQRSATGWAMEAARLTAPARFERAIPAVVADAFGDLGGPGWREPFAPWLGLLGRASVDRMRLNSLLTGPFWGTEELAAEHQALKREVEEDAYQTMLLLATGARLGAARLGLAPAELEAKMERWAARIQNAADLVEIARREPERLADLEALVAEPRFGRG